ncbi:MAG: hypothetical protein R3224_00925 [Balneolaceae bacterium]|nr:hypothetical protein [Balneolaceae bacterium]
MTSPDRATNESPKQVVTPNHPISKSGLNSELARVRSATATYHKVSNAEADGYVQTSPFVPGMGYHYLNGGLVDGQVDITSPEALVYVDNPAKDSKRRLVAVEYIIPKPIIPDKSDLPDLFSGDSDHWHFEDEIHAWTLHAWVWYPNPEGMFHPTNPRVGSGS